MPLTTFHKLLNDAKDRKYAVGSFNAWDMLSARNIIATAEAMRSPVIISLWKTELDFAGEKELFELCISYGRSARVPVIVFLDHAQELEDLKRAISFGATSVMIDGSHLPIQKNIALTSRAAEIAHHAGISIEGELGILGEEEGSEPQEDGFTDVLQAERFVRETGIDALAVAIGNAHGYYRKAPNLDFARLESIRVRVNIPLVLHGGSGIPDRDLQRAIDMGITKVNIGAEGRTAFVAGLRKALSDMGENERWPHRIFPGALESHAALLRERMVCLRSDGKA